MSYPLLWERGVSLLFLQPRPMLDKSGNPRAMRVVMWTGDAGPGWVWPKAHPPAISNLELLPQPLEMEIAVSRFRKLSHTIWHCQYHISWVPKYRNRVSVGPVREARHQSDFSNKAPPFGWGCLFLKRFGCPWSRAHSSPVHGVAKKGDCRIYG